MIPIRLHGLAFTRGDDDASEDAVLLLKMGVGVIPIGAAVAEIEAKGVSLPWLNRWRGDVRYTVLCIGQ